MKKITLITLVFIITFIAVGYCFAASDDNYEKTTQAPEGKAYIVNKPSDKNVDLFQPITELLSLQNKREHLNTNAADYSSDAVTAPDAISTGVFNINPPSPPDGPSGGGYDVNPPKELGQEVQLAGDTIEESTGIPEPDSLTPETGNESGINLGTGGDSEGDAGVEVINLNSLSIK